MRRGKTPAACAYLVRHTVGVEVSAREREVLAAGTMVGLLLVEVHACGELAGVILRGTLWELTHPAYQGCLLEHRSGRDKYTIDIPTVSM